MNREEYQQEIEEMQKIKPIIKRVYFSDLFSAVMEIHDVTFEQLIHHTKNRTMSPHRRRLAWMASKTLYLTAGQIVKLMNRDESTITHSVRKYEICSKQPSEKEARKEIYKLAEMIRDEITKELTENDTN